MFNTLITNAAAVMPLNFPSKDRTKGKGFFHFSYSSCTLCRAESGFLYWCKYDSKIVNMVKQKVGQQTHIRDNMFQPAAQHKKGVENNQAQINDKTLPFEIKL